MHEHRVAHVSLRDPARRNALDAQSIASLQRAIAHACSAEHRQRRAPAGRNGEILLAVEVEDARDRGKVGARRPREQADRVVEVVFRVRGAPGAAPFEAEVAVNGW